MGCCPSAESKQGGEDEGTGVELAVYKEKHNSQRGGQHGQGAEQKIVSAQVGKVDTDQPSSDKEGDPHLNERMHLSVDTAGQGDKHLSEPQKCVASPLSAVSLRDDEDVHTPLKRAIPSDRANESGVQSIIRASFFQRQDLPLPGGSRKQSLKQREVASLLESHGFALPDDMDVGDDAGDIGCRTDDSLDLNVDHSHVDDHETTGESKFRLRMESLQDPSEIKLPEPTESSEVEEQQEH